MATNTGDNHRNGSVKDRIQVCDPYLNMTQIRVKNQVQNMENGKVLLYVMMIEVMIELKTFVKINKQ